MVAGLKITTDSQADQRGKSPHALENKYEWIWSKLIQLKTGNWESFIDEGGTHWGW